MTQKIKEQTEKVPVEQVAKAITNVVETLYTREEIQASPSSFGVKPEVLAGALSMVKEERLTRRQVTEAITKFKKKEVK